MMRFRDFTQPASRFAPCILLAGMLGAIFLALAQQKAPPEPLSRAEENRRTTDIIRVPTATQKLQLLTEFLVQDPNASTRSRLLLHVGIMISREPDTAKRVTLAEKFLALSTSAEERSAALAVLADAYLVAQRTDDAFRIVAQIPSTSTPDVRLLVRLVNAGADQARLRNLQHLNESLGFGNLATSAIDAGLRPGGMNAATWAKYKTKELPAFYQSLAVLSMHAGRPADATAQLQKSAALAPTDAGNYVLLGAAANAEYAAVTQQQAQAADSSARNALVLRVFELQNQVIDAYARALALAAGTAQEPAIRAQVGGELERHYKLLHNGSLDGLQALIDKYKKR